MKEKIINIKNILKIILMIFVIFSCIKSCSKAYNPTQAIIDEINANIVRVANYYGIEHYPTYVANGGIIRMDNIDKYVIFITESDSPRLANQIGAFFPYMDPLQEYSGGALTSLSTTVININNGNQTGVSGNGIYKNMKYKYLYTKVAWASSTGQTLSEGEEIGATILTVPPNPLNYNNLGSQTITINGEEAQAITTLYSYETTLIDALEGYTSGETIYFSLTNTATNQKYENTYTWVNRILSRNSNNSFYADEMGNYMTISVRTRYINLNTIYSLYTKQGENEIQEYVIFYPIGTTFENGTVDTIPSGDFNYNTQDSTNDTISAIDNQTNIFKDLYNNMFTMSSGDIENLIERISGEILPYVEDKTEVLEEIELLQNLHDSEPTDFVISWGNIEYQNKNIIESGEINFNQIVDEWQLTEAHQTAQILMSGALAFLCMKGLWKAITITLGIGTEMYDDYNDEQTVIERENETYDLNTDTITHSYSITKGNKTQTIRQKRKGKK